MTDSAAHDVPEPVEHDPFEDDVTVEIVLLDLSPPEPTEPEAAR